MYNRKRRNRPLLRIIMAIAAVALLVCIVIGGYLGGRYFGIIKPKSYDAAHFGITTVRSSVDFNGNGVDDYTDILLGARKDAQNHPRYDPGYFSDGGYPPDDAGVCTDVVWRAFKNAGYDLKDMIDRDIAANTALYPRVAGSPDPNIDFRRVPNLKVYFSRFAVSLTTDIHDIDQWQPGDIVVFSNSHVGVISDKRNREGEPWLIHNANQPLREEDAIGWQGKISGHYRFDASKIPAEDLIAWHD